MAALAGEERAAREKNQLVRIEKPGKTCATDRGEEAKYEDTDILGEMFDVNLDMIESQVPPEVEEEVEIEGEVMVKSPMPLDFEDKITPVRSDNGTTVPDSESRQIVKEKNGSHLYSHRAALLARMRSLSGSGSGSGSGNLSGADAADTGLVPGHYLSLIHPQTSAKHISYGGFQSATLQVISI